MKPTPDQPSTLSNTLYVASLEKGLRVLGAFGEGVAEMGITEIAAATGLDKSAAQRFTNTLHVLGYLEKDPKSRRYRPALKLLDFSFTFLRHNRLAEIAMHRLIEASKVFGTTVNLCELIGTEVIYTVRIPHEKARYVATVPGRRMPAYCTSPGTAILAYRPWEEAVSIVDASERKPIIETTVVEREAVLERIREAHRDGYGIGFAQAMPNEISVAAPVLDNDGLAFAAVQIPVYTPQWSVDEAREKLAPLAMETARAVSGSLARAA